MRVRAQSCLTLPPHGLYVTYQAPLPMNFPGKNTGVVAIFYATLILLFLLVSV